MGISLKVFKKSSPNGKITIYLGKRDIVDHLTAVEPIDGVVLVDNDYLQDGKVFGQLVCTFRYGREEDEVMGLRFQKDFIIQSEQLFPPSGKKGQLTRLQEKLMDKLGPNAYPFTFQFAPNSPPSVTIQPGPNDQGRPCGVDYVVKIFKGENDTDRTHRRSTVSLGIRKVQFAPQKGGRQPSTIVRKDFMMSPGQLELEATLDQQLYHHGDKIAVNISIRNHSNKTVKKIKVMCQQAVDVRIFASGLYKATVASLETEEGCPINPGSSLQKVMYLQPANSNVDRRGVALDGQLKKEDTNLASSTLLTTREYSDAFGIIISYSVKVKLYLGALAGELVAELPFILMHPKPDGRKIIREDSQAAVETFRQDTIDMDGSLNAEDPVFQDFSKMKLQQ